MGSAKDESQEQKNTGNTGEPLVSVVVPCFNERDTVVDLVRAVLNAPFRKEVIVVDDGSTDGTREQLRLHLAGTPSVRLVFEPRNRGKGAALRRGFGEAKGDIFIIQDADLEYNPAEIPSVIAPILAGEADVVYGSRYRGSSGRVLCYWHTVGNQLLTTFSNVVTNLNLTDEATCYKAFRREVLDLVRTRENHFGFDPEFTAKVAKAKGVRVFEIPVSYRGRKRSEGKKIRLMDGFQAIYCLVRYSFFA